MRWWTAVVTLSCATVIASSKTLTAAAPCLHGLADGGEGGVVESGLSISSKPMMEQSAGTRRPFF